MCRCMYFSTQFFCFGLAFKLYTTELLLAVPTHFLCNEMQQSAYTLPLQ